RLAQQLTELALQSGDERARLARGHAMQDQALDLQHDPAPLHASPRVSASLHVRSNLRYSVVAARTTWACGTGSPRPAARNAAPSAMLRMVPPVTLSRASLSGSRSRVGVVAGKIRRQIAARWALSGLGKLTTKRIRRRKAGSSACRKFVV